MPTKVQDPLKYRIVVRYSEEDAGYIAVVPELRGCSAWGKTESAAIRAVKEAAAAWLEAAKANKIAIPTPLDEKQVTGKFALRMPPELHKELVFEAKVRGSSLNQYIVYRLSKAKG
jgi:predicted RNase H-like HicB family nuclease